MIYQNNFQQQFEFTFDSLLQEKPVNPPEKLVWTDYDIIWLHHKIFLKKLHEARDGRVSTAVRNEVVRWVLSNDLTPFSYVFCCMLDGIEPDEFRLMFLSELKKISSAAH